MPALISSLIISDLYRLGHFNNPAAPTGIREADLPKLTLASSEVKQAIRSYQSFHRPALEAIYAQEKGHTRVLVDGDIGPLTARLFSLERCGCPDYAIEGADWTEPATGNGSWVHSCDPRKPGVHAIKVWINKTNMPRFLQIPFELCWEVVVAAYRNIGVDFVRVGSKTEANIDFGWPIPAGYGSNTIGLAVVPGQAMQCGQQVWARFSTTYEPRDIVNQWARLIAHELGHNLRLQHTSGGIMNPSIMSGIFTRTAWRGDPSEPILARYFGGEPLDDDPPAPPAPGFDPSKLTLIYDQDMYVIKKKVTA